MEISAVFWEVKPDFMIALKIVILNKPGILGKSPVLCGVINILNLAQELISFSPRFR